ncbi:putative Gut-specific cysteine proteinase [Paratrimastix pyriformis]|uniref:Gut-specific cysteine proteinase n=1 Tax=Paratrimastix pyriformis TaxID=342808 RepID=A0ABQ8UFJ1_9EUKA|nr:putative Gut-specific cysteine proteinase [Paratrimastix pyriformis]
MKAILIALFATAALALTAHNANIISRINAHPGNTWRAGRTKFEDWTVEQMKEFLSLEIPAHEAQYANSTANGLPDEFDCRKQWGDCMVAVRDQAQCGSCWAFALSEVLSDRFCIAKCPAGLLSPQDLVSCDYLDSGCNGGNLGNSWSWAKSKGLATDACMPYTSAAGVVAKCPTKCADGSAIVRHKAASYSHIPASGIQQEMFKNGPVEVAFDVYEDFMHYAGGIYKHTTGSYLGGHAVMAVGWGVENGVNYWIVQNSWANKWGEQGYFRIVRGTNECDIESMVYAGPAAC